MCKVLTDENAVSLAEKNAERTIKITTNNIDIASPTPKIFDDNNE